MNTWRDAVAFIDSIDSAHDTELLNAARILSAQMKTLMRRKKRMITVGDETLPVEEWAIRNGITHSAIYGRLKSGWTEADAVSIPHQADGSKFAGKTLAEHSRDTGLSKPCIYARLQRGWTIEAAISTPKIDPKGKRS